MYSQRLLRVRIDAAREAKTRINGNVYRLKAQKRKKQYICMKITYNKIFVQSVYLNGWTNSYIVRVHSTKIYVEKYK